MTPIFPDSTQPSLFHGFYRGIVISNDGEAGKCKIYVPTIYPEDFQNNANALPWAEPATGIFGGNFSSANGLNSETGITGWPNVGSVMWIFFDQGNINYPIYFAACQGKVGWVSEHNKQWVINTDNVRIRIDENPETGTSKFNSYNQNNSVSPSKESNILTTLDIEVKGNVNLRITGSVNLQVNGTVYEEINGDKHQTHIGNLYVYRKGDTIIKEDGNLTATRTGMDSQTVTGNRLSNVGGSDTSISAGPTNITSSAVVNVKAPTINLN